MSLSLWLLITLIYLLALFFFVCFLYFLYQHVFGSQTYFYNQQLEYEKRVMSRPNRTMNEKDMQLSIVFIPPDDAEAAKQQISELEQKIQQNLGTNYSYEIICMCEKGIYRELVKLNKTNLVPVICSYEGIRWLINGTILAKGKCIVHSNFLESQISTILDNSNRQYFGFVEPKIEKPYKMFNFKDFSIPVIVRRDAAMRVLPYVHLLDDGSTAELRLICRQLRIEIQSKRLKFEPNEYSFFRIIWNKSISVIVKFLFEHQYFTSFLNFNF